LEQIEWNETKLDAIENTNNVWMNSVKESTAGEFNVPLIEANETIRLESEIQVQSFVCAFL